MQDTPQHNAATRILVVSDIHAGSTVALCPPDFETIEGHHVRLSHWQEWLYQQWHAMRAWVMHNCGPTGLDALIINGDAIEGMHHRTTEVWSPDPADHCNAAHHLLQPLAELATRANFAISCATAVFGFSIVALSKEIDLVSRNPTLWLTVSFWLTWSGSTLSFLRALWFGLDVRKGHFGNVNPEDAPKFASAQMDLSPPDVPLHEWPRAPESILYQTLVAANELRNRNAERKLKVDKAQVFLVFGISTLLLSLVAYVAMCWGGAVRVEKESNARAPEQLELHRPNPVNEPCGDDGLYYRPAH